MRPLLIAAFLFLAAGPSFLAARSGLAADHNVLMIAGAPSHNYGAHEHYAGLKIIAEAVEGSSNDVKCTVVRGWPEDKSVLDAADSIVIYSDGGPRHPAFNHRDELRQTLKKGTGFVCIHYATEMIPGDPGDDMLDFLGGHFEINYSVNPHWVAEFKTLPDHAVANGVEPFATNDEWYFHLRFADEGKVTPILAAVAPKTTMNRPDGHHSGNPHVRKSVEKGEMQTVAWTFDRPDGGRSFGITGGHFHWNWGNDDMLRVVTNAIRWTAGESIEATGSSLGRPPVEMNDLLQNQAYVPPENFDVVKTAEEFKVPGGDKAKLPELREDQIRPRQRKPKTQGKKKVSSQPADGKQLSISPVVTPKTPGHQVKIEAAIGGVADLYLVVNDGGNGFTCDWADWINPTVSGPAGTRSLVDMKWESATSQFGKVTKNANCRGNACTVDGKPFDGKAIGTHANSTIHFQLPKGYSNFTAIGALDSGGTSQAAGGNASVQFAVYSGAPPANKQAATEEQQREPANALDGIKVADGLQATLSASEPELRSLTNLDIDDRGRVWVCDVMNYRKNNGSRPEGDRILILEDTTGDGVMDKVKTYYQGRDIDSAMGICVLGNEVIVTATPTVWRFTDEDGDDVPDRKEAMFTETGQPQHDHSAHSFLFGPDGKLYWNFGNTGKQVKDADGEIVKDIYGRPVVDNGAPFYGGMPFRCDLDGSNFEVLAHNFRNNWETTVDSFGTLWQSDNDDDGNRGTRINFVMEHGNYGYRDELTGAGWRDARITMEEEIPRRHWHLNDPGVVPNVLLTGAGSPSGICMYEGRLLPKRFWDQVIHCDPGPNVVRAYPMQPDGAGYTATIDPLMTGTTDKWFRPADVCVAPDGSLFVTDWYDPGVGGHNQRDLDRGRLFRIAPPGSKYNVPKFDYSTPAGAIEALKNPNLAVRYKAWMSLHNMGDQAEKALVELAHNDNLRLAARAIWLLGKIEGRGELYVSLAISHPNADIRITGIRLARQLGMTPSKVLADLVEDDSAAVRREVAVALRFDSSDAMPATWAKLARTYQADTNTKGDRWFLEALGIASDVRAAECFEAWMAAIDQKWDTPAGRDIAWRIRAPQAADLVGQIIADENLTIEQTNRYFRSLEYHNEEQRTAALMPLLTLSASERNDAIILRAVERIPDFDAASHEPAAAAIARYANATKGTKEFLNLARRFKIDGADIEAEKIMMASEDTSSAVAAVQFLCDRANGPKRLRQLLKLKDERAAAYAAKLLGLASNGRTTRMLFDTVSDAAAPYSVRSESVRGLAKNNIGAKQLLELAEQKKLPGDTRLLAGGLLSQSQDGQLRERAAQVLPQPQQADHAPLPTLDKLVKMEGDVDRGLLLFRGVATCANCHVVDKFGKEVGPDLSEIGSKLSREAMFTSILDPSGGVSHNYENYIALLESGQIIAGVKVSETDEKLVLRTAEAIDRELDQDEIVEVKKSEKSIMPENLHQTTDQQGLIDIVEYLMTLTKK